MLSEVKKKPKSCIAFLSPLSFAQPFNGLLHLERCEYFWKNLQQRATIYRGSKLGNYNFRWENTGVILLTDLLLTRYIAVFVSVEPSPGKAAYVQGYDELQHCKL